MFLDVTNIFLGLKFEHVESNSLGDGSALSNSHDVSFLYSGESRGAMSGEVFVSLLKSVVLLYEVEIISSEDDGSLHLGGNDHSPIIIIIINIY